MLNISYVTAGLGSLIVHYCVDKSLLCAFGEQLKVLDLVRSIPTVSGFISQNIRSILHHCPNIHTLHFNVYPTVLPPDSGVLHPSLHVIVLRITASASRVIRDDPWEPYLRQHIKTMMGDAFPALCRVELDVTGSKGCPQRFYLACRDLLKRFPLERVEGTVAVSGARHLSWLGWL